MWEAKVNFFKTVSYNILLSCEAVLQKGIWCVEQCCMLRNILIEIPVCSRVQRFYQFWIQSRLHHTLLIEVIITIMHDT